jgi:hypothetical protein
MQALNSSAPISMCVSCAILVNAACVIALRTDWSQNSPKQAISPVKNDFLNVQYADQISQRGSKIAGGIRDDPLRQGIIRLAGSFDRAEGYILWVLCQF